MKNEEHGSSRDLEPEITGGEGNPTLPITEAALDLAALLAVANGGMTPGEWVPGHLHREDIDCDCAYIFSETCMGAVATVGVANNLPLGEGGNDDPPREEARANQLFIATFDPPTVRRLIGLALAAEEHGSFRDHEPTTGFAMEWRCCGCWIPSPGGVRSCSCPTNVVFRDGKTAWKVGSWAKQVAVPKSQEANETITTLQAKIQELWDERRQILVDAGSDELALIARCEAAEQALEGMRAAGERVLKYGIHDDGTPMDWDEWVCFRAALNPTPQGGKL